ncbi:MAG TPA: HAMP domain-containing sensor histidine kinase [Gammaproteobacteria bacterium]
MTAAIAAFGTITVLTAAVLVWSTGQVEHTMATVVRDTRSRAVADELELSLLMYQRIANLYAVNPSAALADARADIAAELERLISEARASISSADEEQLVDEISLGLAAYFEERRNLEARNLDIEDLLRLTQTSLNATVDRLETLRGINEARILTAHARTLRVNRIAEIVALVAGGVLVAASLAAALTLRRYVLAPMIDLHGTISKLRAGDDGARAVSGGSCREVLELAEGFNEMADALARQRQEQLAFLAGVAHDLRNPLGALKLGMQALVQDQSEARRARLHVRLDRHVDRLARMVEDLLDATRIEAGKLEIRPEALDVRDVVEDIVRLYSPTSPDHRIETEMPERPVIVQADPLRVEQVVSNLLSNAIKFSPHGGSIRIVVGEEPGAAVLSVTDSGIGIPESELADVFLPFRRRKTEMAGAGLGLSVVRRIVNAHGGSIEVESRVGAGSTFRVRLPRSEARVDSGVSVEGDSQLVRAARGNGGAMWSARANGSER